jgi:DNA-binding NarL/FixJ family response regulator
MKEQKRKLKLFIMDDSDIFRAGLIEILKEEEAFELSEGEDDLEAMEERCIAAAPDVLIVHSSTRDVNKQLQVANRVKKKAEGTRVLVITEFADIDYLLTITASGCDGYVHSGVSGRSLVKIIQKLGNDVYVFDRVVIDKLLLLEDERRTSRRVEFLPRERKLVEMLAEGKNNAAIGKELNLSTGTVKNIISDMLKRYHFKNRAQLVNALSS